MGHFNWGPGGPPQDAYERLSDQDRFLVLHELAEQAVEDLRRERGARVSEPADVPLLPWSRQVPRIVRLDPPRAGSPLTFIWTDYAIVCAYGWWHFSAIPTCTCDACDEDAQSVTESFRELVDRVVERGFIEELFYGEQTPFPMPADAPAEFRAMLEARREHTERWRLGLRWNDGGGSEGAILLEEQLDLLRSCHEPGRLEWSPWS